MTTQRIPSSCAHSTPCSRAGRAQTPSPRLSRGLVSSSLDAEETSVERERPANDPTNTGELIPPSRYAAHVHRRWAEERTAVYQAFFLSTDDRLRKRAGRIAGCCEFPKLWIRSDGTASIAARRCRDRLCPLCNALRSDKAGERVQRIADGMRAPKFLTLTLRSTTEPLGVQIDNLLASFRRLRQRDAWKRHVRGGAATIEVTLNEKSGLWHPHIHAIIDADFWTQANISDEWAEASGGSRVVDIRAIHDRVKGARYLCKYMAKPCSLARLNSERIIEWAEGIDRRRMVMTFGNAHGTKIEQQADLESELPRTEVIDVDSLSKHAQNARPRPRRLLSLLWRTIPRQLEACGAWRPAEINIDEPLTEADRITIAWDAAYIRSCVLSHTLPDDKARPPRPSIAQAPGPRGVKPQADLFGPPEPARPTTVGN